MDTVLRPPDFLNRGRPGFDIDFSSPFAILYKINKLFYHTRQVFSTEKRPVCIECAIGAPQFPVGVHDVTDQKTNWIQLTEVAAFVPTRRRNRVFSDAEHGIDVKSAQLPIIY